MPKARKTKIFQFKMSPCNAALEATILRFNRVLPEYGFTKEPKRLYLGAVDKWQWFRSCDWKSEIIEITTENRIKLDINLEVTFPIRHFEYENVQFDGRGMRLPYPPRLFYRIRSRGFSAKALRVLKKHLVWFEHFTTPPDCIERAQAEDRNGTRSGELYDKMINFLAARAEE